MNKLVLLITIFLLNISCMNVWSFTTDRFLVKKKKLPTSYTYNIQLKKNYRKNPKVWNSYFGLNWSITIEKDNTLSKNLTGGIGQELLVFRNRRVYFVNFIKKDITDKISVYSDLYKREKSKVTLLKNGDILKSLTHQINALEIIFKDEDIDILLVESSCNRKKQSINCNFSLKLKSKVKLNSKNRLLSISENRRRENDN